MSITVTKKCLSCGKSFQTKFNHQVYCNRRCPNDMLPKSPLGADEARRLTNTGAAHELVVSVYFLKNDCQVFRSMSPNSPCDLVVMGRKGKLLRVEVTTGRLKVSDKSVCNFSKKDRGQFYDVVAVVTHDHQLLFFDVNRNRLQEDYVISLLE